MACRRVDSTTRGPAFIKLETNLYLCSLMQSWTVIIVRISPAYAATEGGQYQCANIWNALAAIGL